MMTGWMKRLRSFRTLPSDLCRDAAVRPLRKRNCQAFAGTLPPDLAGTQPSGLCRSVAVSLSGQGQGDGLFRIGAVGDALYGQIYGLACLIILKQLLQLGHIRYAAAVQGGDHVTAAESGCLRAAAFRHFGYIDAGGDAVGFRYAGGNGGSCDAQGANTRSSVSATFVSVLSFIRVLMMEEALETGMA